jgi:beta-glucosidase
MQVAHHLLLSHGLAVQALRAEGARQPLGIVLNLAHTEPASASEADREQARIDDMNGRCWYTDPLFKGHYPQEAWDALGADAPQVQHGDMAAIATPIDFLGVNYYTRNVAVAGGHFDRSSSGLPLTDMGWEVYPRGLTELLLTLHREYRMPDVYITENGAAFKDVVANGRVHDEARTDYLQTHIAATAEALRQGVPLRGYLAWSLFDNFEWSSGYAKRFGLVHVDYATQQRTLKDSALWFRNFVGRCHAARAA